MTVWFDTTLCPPPVNDRVLVICKTKSGVRTINIGYFDGGGTFHGMGSSSAVTHWMKLPALPKEEQ